MKVDTNTGMYRVRRLGGYFASREFNMSPVSVYINYSINICNKFLDR